MRENEISQHVVECAIEVHRTLGGPGLLESVYEEALIWELEKRGLLIERQIEVPIIYKEQLLAAPLRLDMRIEKLIIVENKATTNYNNIYEAQALTYLRLLNLTRTSRNQKIFNAKGARGARGTNVFNIFL